MNYSLALLLCGLALTDVSGGDWRQFRGPGGSGVSDEKGLPTMLDSAKNLAWKTPLPGRGLSSPLIIGDRIFVTCSSGGQQERLHVICFDATTGAKRWERQFWATGRTTCHEKISVAAPTPVSDGTRLFALFSSNDLICLDLDGNLVWLRGLMRDYPNASNSLGLSSSPVVLDGTLIVQVETDSAAFVAGIDALTGLNRWKIDRPKRVNWTSPLAFRQTDGKTVALLQSPHGISAIDSGTGQSVWEFKGGTESIPSSALRGDTMYIPSRGVTALQISPTGASPKTLWQSNQLRPATASPLALGDKVFTVNDAGVLTCGDAAAGSRLWQLRLKGPFTATPIAAGMHLYLVNEKGLVQVVDTAKSEGVVVSELDLGETMIATPSIGPGALYFRSDGHLWKIAGG